MNPNGISRLGFMLLLNLLYSVDLFCQIPRDSIHRKDENKILLPGTRLQLGAGGYIKTDIMHDFNPIASPDLFDVSKIPVDDQNGKTTHFNVKETRLYLEISSKPSTSQWKAYLEGDFYGSGGGLRIRHAYVDYNNKLLVGQYWSNFMDEHIIPNTLDFEKPAAYAFARHGILRWKQNFLRSYLAVAIEEPINLTDNLPANGTIQSPLPDLTLRYRYNFKSGHIQASSYGAVVRYIDALKQKSNLGLVGFNLSGVTTVGKRDQFSWQLVFGNGVARYRDSKSVIFDPNGQMHSVRGYGVFAGYTHYWSKQWSSLLVVNYGSEDIPAGWAPQSLQTVSYTAFNVIWEFADNAFTGLEYLWGKRINADGQSGSANRLQFSIRYSFHL